MSRLSSEQFAQAREFIMSTVRPLERALFSFEFDTGSPEAVWNELAHFQNPDGGFGRALEPDLRTRQSSVLATVTALKLLRHLATPPSKIGRGSSPSNVYVSCGRSADCQKNRARPQLFNLNSREGLIQLPSPTTSQEGEG